MAKTNESDVWDQDPPGSGRAGSTFVRRTPNLKQASKAKVVRDDWDDDDDDDDEEAHAGDGEGNDEKHGDAEAKAGETKNDGAIPGPRIPGKTRGDAEEDGGDMWEQANKRTPMPELIVASSSTSQSLAPPPPAALQPTLRILKRPSANAGAVSSGVLSSSSGSVSGSASGATSPAPRSTLAEREAQYQEARSRIFGEKEKLSASSCGVVVVRDPLGPASEPEAELGASSQDKIHGLDRPAKGFGERRRGQK